ncbi:RagB/SusD family nutrient uptake outer membrane protein [Sinomicrobium weinanense]|uniref:RagB/SusD family nutrient uptake outer membrane protein n=1 Tax=Sinomicrobium weinanense TaxID=2842200 RepID=A0A926JPM3_9FLAO|nr:RagB/SusD family nutrient uptake outer membrane protein [Sinomicrobium weinanense]MBC9795003.1 RagB/SusD family nutrient uptake outer membrane protein [Sinomicrobium weinanense]MBU3125136.1 RagB/SusD family nutrient uptake outer membrane protein [Sinomicrobium weinanense]
MKGIKNIKIYGVVLTLLTTMSCSDLLDQEPVSITHPDVFWDSQANAEQALAGAYGLFKEAILTQSNFMYWGEWTGMTFMDSRNWIVGYIEGGGNYVLAYRDTSRNWKNFYRVANWAYTMEQYVKEMPVELFDSASEKDRILGEAAFIRGLTYFYMARIWGDVPIVEQSIESSDQLITEDGYIVQNPREPELDVLNYALEATNRAIGLLEYSSPGTQGWAITANKASAEALKAHITLWYASRDNDNADMIQQAIAATTSVINNSGTRLIDYVDEGQEGFDKMCIGQSETGLFEVNISSDMDESFRLRQSDGNHTGLTLNAPIWQSLNTSMSPQMNPDFYGNEMMATQSDRENDVRKELFFYEYEPDAEYSFLMKYSHTKDDPASEDAYALFSESNILIFRLADMYLLRAEANARLGNSSETIMDLNTIRSQANVPDYTGATDRASLMKAIFDERAIEFVGEAQSGYDRIRMDYFEGVPWVNQARNDKKGYFWPVHPSVISINPAIVQTEYWRGKL